MSQKALPTIIFACILVVSSHSSYAMNLVLNGDFSTFVPSNGTGGNWTSSVIDHAGGWRYGPIYGGTFPDGHFVINHTGLSSSDPTLMQLVSGFEVGKTYRLTGDYQWVHRTYGGSGGDPSRSFGVEIGGFLTEFGHPSPKESIASFYIDFVAPANDLLLKLTAERHGNDSTYSVDNISISLVPIPPALWLFSTALIGIAGVVRKHTFIR